MRILITGGSGFICRYLIEDLIKDHHLLLVGQNKDINQLLTMNQTAVPYIYTDYSEESLKLLIEGFNPDSVVHMAAQRPEKHLTLIPGYLQNLLISSHLFSACKTLSIRNIVSVSSISVYSQANLLPWREDGPSSPRNEYGLSKLLVEEIAEFYACRGLQIKTLRLGQVLGLGERGAYSLQIYLDRARKGEPLKVFGNDEGKRHYIYVKDVVHAIKICLKNAELTGIYNIGMKKTYSIFEVAETINTVLMNEAGILRIPEQKADPTINRMSIVKAYEMLGWEPKYDLRSGYEDIYDIISKHNYDSL